jgi:fatty acid desaturase
MRRRLEQARYATGSVAAVALAWVLLGGFQMLWPLVPWVCVALLLLVPTAGSAWLVLHLVCHRLYGPEEHDA